MDSIFEFLNRTYLIERLFGIITYGLVVAFGFAWIKKSKTNKQLRASLIFILFSLILMAFFFVPDSSKDLYRLWDLALYHSKKDFTVFFRDSVLKSSEPLNLLFLYAGGKIGIMGLLPAFSALIFYSCSFSILFLLKKKRLSIN